MDFLPYHYTTSNNRNMLWRVVHKTVFSKDSALEHVTDRELQKDRLKLDMLDKLDGPSLALVRPFVNNDSIVWGYFM